MIDASYCRAFAVYNQWMNEKLYELCATLPDAERKRLRGAFFGSIHATLDHLLYGDLALLSGFTGDPDPMPRLGETLHEDFAELRDERRLVDLRLISWCDGLSESWLAEPMQFTSQTDGIARELPRWILLAHQFNHQTHHRGQLTTLLSQLGLDAGETDLHKLPHLGDLLKT